MRIVLDLKPDHAVDGFVVETRPDRERVIVAPCGELDMVTVEQVGVELDELVRVGFTDLVLDLRGLTFMDVSGLRFVADQARREDATVELIDGRPAVSRLFDLARVRAELPFRSPHELARRRF
jgi:anti-sigma B factor antagonist